MASHRVGARFACAVGSCLGAYRWNRGHICAPGHGGGTKFTLEADVRPTGFYRVLGPIFGLLGRRQNRADVAKLKDILEA